MSAVSRAQYFMRLWGWTNSGHPGSVKLGPDGIVARYGDPEWVADMDAALTKVEEVYDFERQAG
jgi:hypothetical protein